MKSRWIWVLVIGLFLFVSGCETAKGFKKDVTGAWGNLQKADEWVKENLW